MSDIKKDYIITKANRTDKKANSLLECGENETRCNICLTPKDDNEFVIQYKTGNKITSKFCNTCRNERKSHRKHYYDKNRDKMVEISREYKLKTNYKYELPELQHCEVCKCNVKNLTNHLKTKKHINILGIINELKEKLNK